MKTIGLIGGMSWESTAEYYRIINETVRDRLGGLHSARIVLYSVDFAEIEALQARGDWDKAAEFMIAAARHVEGGGADCVLICTNTMHKVADAVEQHVNLPLLHITDVTAASIRAQGLSRVGLLGTRFTMEDDFYKGRLKTKHGLNVIVPDDEGRNVVHRVIYDELCRGIRSPSSRAAYVRVIENLARRGAEGIILGCTEIGLLLAGEQTPVPLFDTTEIHARAAAEYALGA
jgi:aspartate racemase